MHSVIKDELTTISTVALYEFKSQFRTTINLIMWIFLIPLAIYTVKLTGMAWVRCIPASPPYMTLVYANFIITVFGIFFTSAVYEDIRQNKSNDFLFVRSFSNISYILGKFLGIIYIFLPVVAFMLSITLLFNGLIFHNVNVVFRYYLLYPLLISLPVLFFTIGTNLLVMFIVRVKGLYFFLLFIFYLFIYMYLLLSINGVFDFWGFYTPMLASDFIGMGNMQSVLTHRAIYIFWGCTCLCVCTLAFKRLNQSGFSRVKVLALTVCGIAALICFHHLHQIKFIRKNELRSEMKALNDVVCEKPRLTIHECDLKLTHEKDSIDVRASLLVKNETDTAINTCYFSLNPGLEVHSVVRNDKKAAFDRDIHILAVTISVESGSSAALSIHYSGSINEDACYTDIDETKINAVNNRGFLCIDKRLSFITSDYVLLTPENGWYPTSGVPFGSVFPKEHHRDFVSYTLSVTSKAELIAISPGAVERIDETTTRFVPEHPLPQLSLVIGDYLKKTIDVDGVEYSMYVKTGHDNFSSRFNDIQDKLPELIRVNKNKFEVFLGLDYPFKRFSLVEVPVQFIAYQRYWNNSPATLQPEQVFIQERGFLESRFDVERAFEMAEQYPTPKIKTPVNIQSAAFNSLVNPLLRPSLERKINRYLQSKSNRLSKIPLKFISNYNVMPDYFDFTNNFVSDNNPFFHQSIDAYLATKQDGFGMNDRIQFPEFGSMSDYEVASHVYRDRTVYDVCADPEMNDIKYEALKVKNISVFKMISALMDGGDFDKYLLNYLSNTRFKTATQHNFFDELDSIFNIDAEPVISRIYSGKGLPAFSVADVEHRNYKGADGIENNYSMTVQNIGDVSGIFSVILRSPSSYISPGSGDIVKKEYILKPREARRIGISFDYRTTPLFNTNISGNIPNAFFEFPKRMHVTTKDDFFIGDTVLENYVPPVEEGAIIIDNTDPGFEVYNKSKTGITKFFTFENEIDRIVPYSLRAEPERWQHFSSSHYYGFPVKSFHAIKRGDGENRARWHVDVPESGMYNVYCYRTMAYLSVQTYHYIVHHDDGVDEVINRNTGTSPWRLIGTWHFSKGRHLVELTDESDSRVVEADAIKFVKANKDDIQ